MSLYELLREGKQVSGDTEDQVRPEAGCVMSPGTKVYAVVLCYDICQGKGHIIILTETHTTRQINK